MESEDSLKYLVAEITAILKIVSWALALVSQNCYLLQNIWYKEHNMLYICVQRVTHNFTYDIQYRMHRVTLRLVQKYFDFFCIYHHFLGSFHFVIIWPCHQI
jgi:hypothetical protein